VVPVVLRPRPVEPVGGRRVAFFSTAEGSALARLEEHLRNAHGADVVHGSGNLARRDELRRELSELTDVDAYVTEIKAAAIDVVAEAAEERGVRLVFADADVVSVAGTDLDGEVRALAEASLADERVVVR
jgi:cyclic 2,3-diphosphoglycerate synthetase